MNRTRSFLVIVATFVVIVSTFIVIVSTFHVIVSTFVHIVATIQFPPNLDSISLTKKQPFAKAVGCQIKIFRHALFRTRTFLVIVSTFVVIVATFHVIVSTFVHIVATIQLSPNSHAIYFTKKSPSRKREDAKLRFSYMPFFEPGHFWLLSQLLLLFSQLSPISSQLFVLSSQL